MDATQGTRRIACLVALGSAILLASGCAEHSSTGGPAGVAETAAQAHGSGHDGMTTAEGGSPSRATVSAREFLDQMIPHHEMAVAMAQMAVRSARDQNVRAAAKEIITFQVGEIRQMRAWRTKWFGSDTAARNPTATDFGLMGMSMHMGELAAARPFDEAFLASMIGHHAGGIVLSRRAIDHPGQRPEVTALASRITKNQAYEIGLMNGYLQNFRTFGVALPEAKSPPKSAVPVTP